MVAQALFKLGDRAVFHNCGPSGVTSNDGRLATIVRVKPSDEWVESDMPGYVIEFDGGGGFGVNQIELTSL